MLTPDDVNPPIHDLKWGHIVGFAATTQVFPPMKNPEINAIADNFHTNIQRIKSMLVTPTLIGDLTMDIQRCYDYAELQITKTISDPILREFSQAPAEIAKLANSIFHLNNKEMIEAQEQGGPAWEEYFLASLNRGTAPVIMLQITASGAGLEAMLSGAITGTWTAYETMAGDLWETAVNVHPKTLAELKGKKKRKENPDDEDEETVSPKENLKQVLLSEILRHQYDIRNKMGSVHREQRRFDTLSGIREAYRMAFCKKYADVDAALDDKSIDAVNAVRNLIVHRSGIVDQDYEKQSKFLPIPKAKQGEPILLDGEIAMDLMIPIIKKAIGLIHAVDEWIAAN